MNTLELNTLKPIGCIAILIIAIAFIGCESDCDDGNTENPTTGESQNGPDAKEDTDASVETDASTSDQPIVLAATNRCLDEEDCDGNYCCPLFHYCVERCDELGETCSDPNYICKQGYAEPLCNYVGPDLEKEYAQGEGGAPCMLDEDCLPGFFCAPTLRFCVERCDEEGEICPATGHTCTMPNAYDVFELPLLACVYQEGDSTGEGASAAEPDDIDPASQQQKEDACHCMFASEVYPNPSLEDSCIGRIPDKCVKCLEDSIEDTSDCNEEDEEAVLSCTDPCARTLPPPETAQECEDFLVAIDSPLPTSETDCYCENCTYWYGLCLVDPDCYEHLACTIETECSGFECSTTCEEITNRLLTNNPDSINISREVAQCTVDADCR